MNNTFQISTFQAKHSQKLRNVTMHSPSLIQILSGNKELFWKENSITLSNSTLLLCHAGSSLSFENRPDKGPFLSRMFSFHCLPEEKIIQLNDGVNIGDQPIVSNSKSLEGTLNALATLDLSAMSESTQKYWVMPLFQQLAEKGCLHHLFPQKHISFRCKLSHYLSLTPGDAHPLESVAEKFAMSRATLIRKLKKEDTQYRELLAEVRLNHALNLMQDRQWSVIQLAQMCGYQSEERFSQRFRKRYGLSPSDYMRTIYIK